MASGNEGGMQILDEDLQPLQSRNIEDTLQSELERILQEHRNKQFINRERDHNVYRSGSAPPTVEGSLSAVGSLLRNSDFGGINGGSSDYSRFMCEDEMRSHPAYLFYYYSHEGINPRLPPPLLSKEDWRVTQRIQVGGSSIEGFEDWRKKLATNGDSSSPFSMQPGFSVQQAENDLMELRKASGLNIPRQNSVQMLDRHVDGFARMSGADIGVRRKSFADILQLEGLDQPALLSNNMSRASSHKTFGDIMDSTRMVDCEPLEGLRSAASSPAMVELQNYDVTVSDSFTSAVGSTLSRVTTPEQQVIGKFLGSSLPPVGSKVFSVEKNGIGLSAQFGHSSSMTELADMVSSRLNLSNTKHAETDSLLKSKTQMEVDNPSDAVLRTPSNDNNFVDLSRRNKIVRNLNILSSNEQVNPLKKSISSASHYSKRHSAGNVSSLPSMDVSGSVPGAYLVNSKLNAVYNNHPNAAVRGPKDGQSLNALGNQVGPTPDLHSTTVDLRFIQCLQLSSDYLMHGMSGPNDPSQIRNSSDTLHGDLEGFQKAYLEALLAQQKQQYELPLLSKSGLINYRFFGSQPYGPGMQYPGRQIANSLLPSIGAGNPLIENEHLSYLNFLLRSSTGGSVGSWHTDIGNNMEGRFESSLLDEFKNNKGRPFELSDIVDNVVQFSTDQYGSRFIQQKLEMASVEEKTKIFPEIIRHACALMTDVFGNYVIQKFFEHGTESQREELASQLTGHVLPLSLQMYGCRVIQKALEVVDVNQQTKMVSELDGSIMKCVCDQNGNHVIQKCI